MISPLVLLLVIILVCLSHADEDVSGCAPKCYWDCNKPKCPLHCVPVCKNPHCEIRCEEGPTKDCHNTCQPPVCEVRCPKQECGEQVEVCPGCRAYCNPADCHEECPRQCKVFCEEPECAMECLPSHKNCEKPKCDLVCEQPTCSIETEKKCCECNHDSLKRAVGSIDANVTIVEDAPSFVELFHGISTGHLKEPECCPCPVSTNPIPVPMM